MPTYWNRFVFVAAAAAGLVMASSARVNAAVIIGNSADAGVDDNNAGTPQITAGTNPSSTFRIGYSGLASRAGVYPFLLPDLGAVSNPFTTASVAMTASTAPNVTLPSAIDLAGLPTRTSPTVLGTDFSAAATPIQAGFLPTSGTPGVYSTNTDGSSALLAYLNAAYADGAGAGRYVFLRLKPTTEGGSVSYFTGYNINAAENGSAASRPVITYSVPEPGSLALVVGGIATMLLRRRNCR